MWEPRSESDLRSAAAAGLLEETHHLDLKRQLDQGTSATKGLAKDIAAFALDGGLILIGVDEDTSPPGLWPVPLSGLPERVEQIATMGIDEPVRIRTTVIESETHPGQGYLAVHIPPSPRAPHMAGGKYYGRGDKTNRVLTHTEVLRLHEHQLNSSHDVVAAARGALAKVSTSHEHPLLALVAQPLGAPNDLLTPLSESSTWQETVLTLTQTALASTIHHQYEPCLVSSSGFDRRPGGVAITTGMYNGRRFENDDHSAELVFAEDGQLTLLSERAISTMRFEHVFPEPPSAKVVFEELIIGHIDLLSRVAAAVSKQWGFHGSWRFGLAMNGMTGARSWATAQRRFGDRGGPTYTDTDYERATEVTLLDLTADPQSVARALVGQLLRSIGSADTMSKWLKPDH